MDHYAFTMGTHQRVALSGYPNSMGANSPHSNYPRLCKVCNISLPHLSQFEAHCIGKRHWANLKRLHGVKVLTAEMIEEDRRVNSTKNSDPRFCPVCNIYLQDVSLFDSHRASKNHQTNLKELNGVHKKAERTLEMIEADRQYIWFNQTINKGRCNLCAVKFSSEPHMLDHCAGKKHLSKVKYASATQHSGGSLGKCEICNVIFDNISQMNQHLNGRRHLQECRMKGIPIHRPNKRFHLTAKHNPWPKRVKTVGVAGKNSMPQSKQTTKAKAVEKEATKMISLTKSGVTTKRKKPAKETPDPASKETNEEEVHIAQEAALPVEEEHLFPHQVIEIEADEAYLKYTETGEDHPKEAHALYTKYREIYTRYEIAYQEYADSLNMQKKSEMKQETC